MASKNLSKRKQKKNPVTNLNLKQNSDIKKGSSEMLNICWTENSKFYFEGVIYIDCMAFGMQSRR